MRYPLLCSVILSVPLLTACQNTHEIAVSTTKSSSNQDKDAPQWLAGDHHIHGKYSARWDWSTKPPTPILRGDAQYATALYAQMAKHHQLSWMVTTDHGGPQHSYVNLNQAYPELVASRKAIPEVLQFYGMEFDTPGARHCSLIIPYSADEAEQLFRLESTFNRREIEPDSIRRDTNAFMLTALNAMQAEENQPILIVNHPARLADKRDSYKKVTPAKLRQWQDTAPDVVIGMEGAPGHQANALNPDGSIRKNGLRGGYHNFPTMGGFDQMTAIVGGVWDSMLSEGRQWWITATSDSHMHYTEGRTDFWPGEYSKTYVFAKKQYDDIMHAMREGKIFVTTGDLIDSLFVEVTNTDNETANIGETITVTPGDTVTLTIKFRDPDTQNFGRQNPSVERIDVIVGTIHDDRNENNIPIVRRFTAEDWRVDGQYRLLTIALNDIRQAQYVRVRGTNNGNELEPEIDAPGENPWSDLWFYSNPVFIQLN